MGTFAMLPPSSMAGGGKAACVLLFGALVTCCAIYATSFLNTMPAPGAELIREQGAEELELVQAGKNWADCVMSHPPGQAREHCLKRWRLSDNPAETHPESSESGGGGGDANELASKQGAAKSAVKSASKEVGDTEKADKAKAAKAAMDAAKQAAKDQQEKKQKSADALAKAQQELAAQSAQAGADKDKIEKWYKEKVAKVNAKLSADKVAIRHKKVADIEDAKKAARKSGAHVGDIMEHGAR